VSPTTLPPWAIGPFELIQHAREHLKHDGDVDRRIALIGFDNAIEICIDTFLTLNPKIRGGRTITNEEVEKARKNYHTKLEFFYRYMQEKGVLIETSIKDILWYHQLRNQLYHSGNGLVPEKQAIVGAQSAALLIYKSLFELDTITILEGEKRRTTSFDDVISQLSIRKAVDLPKISAEPLRQFSLVVETLRQKGHILLYWNPNTRRFCRVCELEAGKYGMQIIQWNSANSEWEEITAFINKGNTLDKVRKYLSNGGYVEYNKELPGPF
jgi:hypothetical protein